MSFHRSRALPPKHTLLACSLEDSFGFFVTAAHHFTLLQACCSYSMVISLGAYHTTLIVSAGQLIAPMISMAKNIDRSFAPTAEQAKEAEKHGKLILATSKGIFSIDFKTRVKTIIHLLRSSHNAKILELISF